MEFSKTLRRAWEITWRYKILWVFGFILSLAGGGSGGAGGGRGGSGVNYNLPGQSQFDLRWGVALVVLIALAILLGLAFAALSVIARGALIDGVRQAEEQGQVSGKSAWKMGASRFWSLLGIYLLVFLLVLALMLPVIALIALGAVAGASGSGRGWPVAVPFICGGMLLAIPFALAGIALSLVNLYAECACVLEGLGVVASLKKGWQTLKSHIGDTLIVGVILLVINGVIAAVFFGGIVAIALPAIALWTGTRNAWITAAPLCLFGSLFVLLALFVGTLGQTFTSTLWTLTYRQLTGHKNAE